MVERQSGSRTHFAPDEHSSRESVRWRLEYVKRVIREKCGSIQLSLKTLSAQVGVSEQHLGRVFKSATGFTFRAYLREVRIVEAKRLLSNPRLSVKEVACHLGYSEPSNFVKDFHAIAGMTPVSYRNCLYDTGSTTTASIDRPSDQL